jgi:hypothetical protein
MPTNLPADMLFGLPRSFVEYMVAPIEVTIIVIMFVFMVLRPLVRRMEAEGRARRFQHITFTRAGGETAILRVDRLTGESWTMATGEDGKTCWAAVPVEGSPAPEGEAAPE